jgi:hypothetical protein
LSKRRESLDAVFVPAAEGVEGQGRKGGRIGSAFRIQPIYSLAVLILLPLPHWHDHIRRRFVRFGPFVPQVNKYKVDKLNIPFAFTPSDDSMAYTKKEHVRKTA